MKHPVQPFHLVFPFLLLTCCSLFYWSACHTPPAKQSHPLHVWMHLYPNLLMPAHLSSWTTLLPLLLLRLFPAPSPQGVFPLTMKVRYLTSEPSLINPSQSLLVSLWTPNVQSFPLRESYIVLMLSSRSSRCVHLEWRYILPPSKVSWTRSRSFLGCCR